MHKGKKKKNNKNIRLFPQQYSLFLSLCFLSVTFFIFQGSLEGLKVERILEFFVARDTIGTCVCFHSIRKCFIPAGGFSDKRELNRRERCERKMGIEGEEWN